MPSYSVRRSRIKEFKEIAGNVTDSVAQKILEAHNWNVQESLNDYFNNRWKYPEAKSGSKDKVKKLFREYADKTDPEVMSEAGMLKFFKAVNVNPEGYETLVISWTLSAEEMGLISSDEFVNGFVKLGCSSISDIKSNVRSKVNSLSNDKQFKTFYKWIFQYAKEDEKKKTIPKDLGVQLWKIILQHKQNTLPLLEKFLTYLAENDEVKAISKDVWALAYDFLKETKKATDYDDSGAWPVLIDEFIEHLIENKSK